MKHTMHHRRMKKHTAVVDGAVRKVARGLCALTYYLFSSGVNFFTSLYVHPMERENCITLRRKQEEAKIDLSIITVARSIASLDENIAVLKGSVANVTPCGYEKFNRELRSTETQRDSLVYMLAALRGRLDAPRLMSAVKTLADNVGLQLTASAYVNRKAVSLAVQRDLDDSREPITKESVDDLCRDYGIEKHSDNFDVI